MTTIIDYCSRKFGLLYCTVAQMHDNAPLPHRGHGLDHDITVAAWVLKITRPKLRFIERYDSRTIDKAVCAAMIHSVDRMIGREDVQIVEAKMRETLASLPANYFTAAEVDEIVEAALRHAEKNQPDQKLVQQLLMDADRLANMMPTVIIRSGQFHPEIPALNLQYLKIPDPRSTYRDPSSVIEDLRGCIEWRSWFRTPLGKKYGRRLARGLERYIQSIADGYQEIGLLGVEL